MTLTTVSTTVLYCDTDTFLSSSFLKNTVVAGMQRLVECFTSV